MSSPRQYSNPLLWSVILVGFIVVASSMFSFWYARGAEYGATKPRPDGSGGVEVPDHAALIANVDDDVLDLGRSVYQANCVSCHGPDGRAGVSGALVFPEGQFRNGADPWSQYQTLVSGLGLMPAQRTLSSEERYAVIHYIRDAFLREDNPDQYIEIDDEYLASGTWPQPGEAGEGEARHPYGANARKPLEIPVKALSYQRVRAGMPAVVGQWREMLATADISEATRARLQAASLNAFAISTIMQAIASDDVTVFAASLTDFVPGFALHTASELRALQEGLGAALPDAPTPLPVPDEVTDGEIIEADGEHAATAEQSAGGEAANPAD